MLTKVVAYTSVAGAPTLVGSFGSTIFTDPLRIRNITGLEPVKASINTAPFPSIPGAAFIDSNIPTRNIVMTLHPNPDWSTWTVESLRKLVYLYFQPGSPVQLVFDDDSVASTTIFGYVESCEPNPFAKDIEFPISIICPDPYFSSLNPIVVTGRTVNTYTPATITYNGDVPTGIKVEVDFHTAESIATSVQVQAQDPSTGVFSVDAEVDDHQYFVMSSVDGNKYVDTVRSTSGVVVSKISEIADGYTWPKFVPGDNPFCVITDAGLHDFTLTYFERFGGL